MRSFFISFPGMRTYPLDSRFCLIFVIFGCAEISLSSFVIEKNVLDLSMTSKVKIILEIKVNKNILVNIS